MQNHIIIPEKKYTKSMYAIPTKNAMPTEPAITGQLYYTLNLLSIIVAAPRSPSRTLFLIVLSRVTRYPSPEIKFDLRKQMY